jgi:hypothetical protein
MTKEGAMPEQFVDQTIKKVRRLWRINQEAGELTGRDDKRWHERCQTLVTEAATDMLERGEVPTPECLARLVVSAAMAQPRSEEESP